VFDHVERTVYLVCLVKKGQEEIELESCRVWFANVEHSLASASSKAASEFPPAVVPESKCGLAFALHRSRKCYQDDIQACLDEIKKGESYELCLTNKVTTSLRPNPLDLYLRLRQFNPAPYAAFLKLEQDLHITSSSPEKFLSVDNSCIVECKPIKGTMPRGATQQEDEILKNRLQSSLKDFSENLMIVDLVRNDIGRVCEIGSVYVPRLMHVESFATVHQLVSTVRGQMRAGLSALDCIRYSFPPGSMTGAPKLRSMQILNRLEKAPRGPYSGVLGYLGVTGPACFNVVIRTAVIGSCGTTIGCGGAVVADSNIQEEFDEMVLKAGRLIYTFHNVVGLDIPLSLPDIPPNPNLNWANLICAGQEH